jgi:hypothetical protein
MRPVATCTLPAALQILAAPEDVSVADLGLGPYAPHDFEGLQRSHTAAISRFVLSRTIEAFHLFCNGAAGLAAEGRGTGGAGHPALIRLMSLRCDST